MGIVNSRSFGGHEVWEFRKGTRTDTETLQRRKGSLTGGLVPVHRTPPCSEHVPSVTTSFLPHDPPHPRTETDSDDRDLPRDSVPLAAGLTTRTPIPEMRRCGVQAPLNFGRVIRGRWCRVEVVHHVVAVRQDDPEPEALEVVTRLELRQPQWPHRRDPPRPSLRVVGDRGPPYPSTGTECINSFKG